MPTIVKTPPAPVVTVAQAATRLRMGDVSPQQYLDLAAMVEAATGNIDGPSGWLGRAIGLQTLEAAFDDFPGRCPLRLPYPPLVAVSAVTYLDPSGSLQSMPTSSYSALGNAVTASSWPNTARTTSCVRVQYLAGYAVVPEMIKSAILLMVQAQYDGDADGSLVRASRALLEPLLVYR